MRLLHCPICRFDWPANELAVKKGENFQDCPKCGLLVAVEHPEHLLSPLQTSENQIDPSIQTIALEKVTSLALASGSTAPIIMTIDSSPSISVANAQPKMPAAYEAQQNKTPYVPPKANSLSITSTSKTAAQVTAQKIQPSGENLKPRKAGISKVLPSPSQNDDDNEHWEGISLEDDPLHSQVQYHQKDYEKKPSLFDYRLKIRIIPNESIKNIGIHITHESIFMAMLDPSDQAHSLKAYKEISLSRHGMTMEDPRLAEDLKHALYEFCGQSKRNKIWTVLSSSLVGLRRIFIPMVPKHQISNAVYWTFKREKSFDEKSLVLDFEVQGEVNDQGLRKLAVLVYTCPLSEVTVLKDLYLGIGYPLSGITLSSFAIQNLFRTKWVPLFEDTVANLSIGHERSQVEIISHNNVVLVRAIKSGTKSLLDALIEGYHHEFASASAPALDYTSAQKLIRDLHAHAENMTTDHPIYKLNLQQVFEFIRPAIDRLISRIEMTIKHYSVNMGKEKINRILLSGEIDFFPMVAKYIGNQLDMVKEIVDPFHPEFSKHVKDSPAVETIFDRVRYATSIGLALSNNHHTPNLLFTYKEKDQHEKISRINRTIFLSFFGAMAVCFSIFLWQMSVLHQYHKDSELLQQKMQSFNPRIEHVSLVNGIELLSKIQGQKSELSRKYMYDAIIQETLEATPVNIQIKDLNITFENTKKLDVNTLHIGNIRIEGTIRGSAHTFQTELAGYILKLRSSRILLDPKVLSDQILDSKDGLKLSFVIAAQIRK